MKRNFVSKLAPIIREYLEHRKMLGYTNGHEEDLALFDSYCREYYPDLETLTKESVRNWISYETARGIGGMYNRITSLRMLALYMGGGAYVVPMKAVAKRPECVPYILTDDELSLLFVAADNIKGKFNISVKTMFPTMLRLLYTCGLRPPEVRLIKRDNINFDTGEILIEKAKGQRGHKERIVVMSDDMLLQCRKYDVVRAISNPKSEYFFVRSDNTPMPQFQLYLTLKNCWERANPGIPRDMLPWLRPYDLRHRFATAVLQKWVDEKRDLYAMLPYLSAYMGHANFSATAYYIHLLPQNLLNSAGVDWDLIDEVTLEVDVWKS